MGRGLRAHRWGRAVGKGFRGSLVGGGGGGGGKGNKKNLIGKPVRKVAAITRNFSHGVHTFLKFLTILNL